MSSDEESDASSGSDSGSEVDSGSDSGSGSDNDSSGSDSGSDDGGSAGSGMSDSEATGLPSDGIGAALAAGAGAGAGAGASAEVSVVEASLARILAIGERTKYVHRRLKAGFAAALATPARPVSPERSNGGVNEVPGESVRSRAHTLDLSFPSPTCSCRVAPLPDLDNISLCVSFFANGVLRWCSVASELTGSSLAGGVLRVCVYSDSMGGELGVGPTATGRRQSPVRELTLPGGPHAHFEQPRGDHAGDGTQWGHGSILSELAFTTPQDLYRHNDPHLAKVTRGDPISPRTRSAMVQDAIASLMA